MAYNILKGTVEFTGDNGSLENTVDLATDQSISGGKTFNQRLTASAITMGGTVLSHPSITAVNNSAAYRVALFDASSPNNTLSGNADLSFRYGALTSSVFTGSGVGLTNLQAQEVINKLSASQINIGSGLKADSYNVAVSASHAIAVGATGVSVRISPEGGMAISESNGIAVDPTNALDITTGGQSLSDVDVFIAHDQSRGKIVKADALDIYNYINGKLSSPAITTYADSGNGRVVIGTANPNNVAGAANLTFTSNTLTVNGTGSFSGPLTAPAITSSVGVHVSGATSRLSIGDVGDATNNGGMLFIRPTDTSNRALCLMQSKESEGNRVIFAVTGSGQVLVGGGHIAGGVLSVSGSDLEKLITAKSDSEDLAFYVSGSGDAALSGRLALKSDTTTDPTTLTNHAHIYAKDVATSAEVFVRDEAGNVTQISPHTPEGEWQYFSRNTRTGKVVRVNMERMIRKLEEFTGESFMEEWYEDPTD